jgi:hypothetical protein
MWLVAIALLTQSLGISGYVLGAGTDQLRLVMPEGSFELSLGPGCEFLSGDVNVDVLLGSHDSAVLIADRLRCPALVGYQIDDVPCVQNASGDCDLAAAI